MKYPFSSRMITPGLLLAAVFVSHPRTHAQVAPAASVQPAGQVASSIQPSPAAAASPVGTPSAEPIHIGITAPHSTITDASAQMIGEQVRVLLARYLASPDVDAVLLFSALPEMVSAEAKQHHCTFIVDSTITQKKGSGLNKMMLLQGASMMMPMASIAGSMGGMIAGTAAGAAASTASSMGGFMHANNTWTLDYKLLPVGAGTPVLTQSETAKAKKEGDDVLTPMVEHAALAISTQARKK